MNLQQINNGLLMAIPAQIMLSLYISKCLFLAITVIQERVNIQDFF